MRMRLLGHLTVMEACISRLALGHLYATLHPRGKILHFLQDHPIQHYPRAQVIAAEEIHCQIVPLIIFSSCGRGRGNSLLNCTIRTMSCLPGGAAEEMH